jgi:hypothetical protein
MDQRVTPTFKKGETMIDRKILLRLLATVAITLLIVTAASAKIREQEHNSDISRMVKGHSTDRVLCIDGMKVFQTIAFGAGNGYGAAVSNIQLYEEKNGKVVPAICTDKRKKKIK